MSDGFEQHTSEVTFGEVAASGDVDELYEWAEECLAEPAEPDKCPACFAYMRAQKLQWPNRFLDVDEPPC